MILALLHVMHSSPPKKEKSIERKSYLPQVYLQLSEVLPASSESSLTGKEKEKITMITAYSTHFRFRVDKVFNANDITWF